ncbi:DNA adenine methylase [Salegentibacter echinorum]|uniref:Site-specific DNA-methyltransferase (adenine-specific) n=1 Tax=Salegentibacter echinorum TaxID=1073325 RepID=A0A1M5GCB3_SALEC|nr:Dam family site-specific DNA-(adenine-N6)-methyltransferase [Salegentibacter echinorum]SHG01385.1 DNA adenine methylase [Salegentibacter echinorum]
MTKPILRWAGGKRWLIKQINDYLPGNINNYYEPFAGGLSILIYLLNNQKIRNISTASDTNPHLINFYNTLKQDPERLINSLKSFKNTEDNYYKERAKNRRTNHTRAAKFLYLNRTSFNGIYRENLKGEYNVPYGKKSYDQLFDYDQIYYLSEIFQNTLFENEDFAHIDNFAERDDLVFLDPPYTVAHENNGFVKYNQKIFSWEDQIRLKDMVERLDNRGVNYILTNAKHISIEHLYQGIGNIHNVSRSSLIGGKGAKRSKYNEIIITNAI